MPFVPVSEKECSQKFNLFHDGGTRCTFIDAGFLGGWVALSLSLPHALTLSLRGFTSHCSARKSVRTFVVVMVTDIKR